MTIIAILHRRVCIKIFILPFFMQKYIWTTKNGSNFKTLRTGCHHLHCFLPNQNSERRHFKIIWSSANKFIKLLDMNSPDIEGLLP